MCVQSSMEGFPISGSKLAQINHLTVPEGAPKFPNTVIIIRRLVCHTIPVAIFNSAF